MRQRTENAAPREPDPSTDCVARFPVLERDVAVVEVLLLVTVHQARELEAVASQRGLTVAQLARHLIRCLLDQEGRALYQS